MRTAGIDLPPPAIEQERGGGDTGWVQLFVARDDIEAHLLLRRLELTGIETQVMKDHSAPGAWFYGGSNPNAPVAILVRRYQLVDARVVLAEIAFDGPASQGGRLPTAERNWRFSLTWWAIALALGAAFTAIGLARTAELFQRCGLDECATANP